jgi:hypothetical protein
MTKMNLPRPLAFMPAAYTDGDTDPEVANDADDQVRPLKGQVEPAGRWEANQKARGALPSDTAGRVVKRVQGPARQAFVDGVIGQFMGKARR